MEAAEQLSLLLESGACVTFVKLIVTWFQTPGEPPLEHQNMVILDGNSLQKHSARQPRVQKMLVDSFAGMRLAFLHHYVATAWYCS